MNNIEKGKELVQKYKFGDSISPIVNDRMYDAVLEMAEWKDEQFEKQKKEFLNKACEWLTENIDISKRPSHIVMDFRKYMEE